MYSDREILNGSFVREPNEIVVCTEFCSKGSLQDILEDDDVKLDNMFIASLVMDLVKGKKQNILL